MKTLILLCLTCIFSTTSWTLAQPLSTESWFQITKYSDEFNNYTLDTCKWCRLAACWCTCSMGAKYNPDNLKTGQFASDGSVNKVLQITTKTLPHFEHCYCRNDTIFSDSTRFSTGMLTLLDSATSLVANLKYGYYEMNCKIPVGGRNVASSFWLWNARCPNSVPAGNIDNEIDIFELNSCFPTWFSHSIHLGYYTCDPPNPLSAWCAYNFENLDNPDQFTNLNFASSFHIFGLDWEPNYIDYYIDGVLISHVVTLDRDPKMTQNQKVLYPDLTKPISEIQLPMMLVINGGWTFQNLPDDQHYGSPYFPLATGENFEVDYFHYYKRKPTISNATYNSSNNRIILTVSTNNPGDSFSWTTGPYVTIIGPTNTNSATIALAPAYNNTYVDVSATGTNPTATTTSRFTFQQGSGNLCNIPAQSKVFVSTNIVAPISGCSNVLVASGTVVTFVSQNEITLNPGFEVQLGGTLLCVTN
jgi:hypothetical protein